MSIQVCTGAMMTCTYGASSATLNVIAHDNVMSTTPAANITDYAPITNIPTFGVCSSLSNPTVASATSAALGVLTTMPCVPATAAPWTPGSATVLIANMPALTSSSTCSCSYGGTIAITSAGQSKAQPK